MNRYIDFDKLGIGRGNPDVFESKDYVDGWNSAISILEKADAEDVVKVVRCKDCKYAKKSKTVLGIPDYECLKTGVTCLDADDFCSYGGRKDKE